MKNPIVITLIVALIVGVGAFFGGMKYAQVNVSSASRSQMGGDFRGQAGDHAGGENSQGRNGGGNAVIGEIISLDDKSVTVKLEDGSSKIILFSNTTRINKEQEAQTSDLKNGERISAFGTTNPDGSITARSIQLNPQFRGMDENRPTGASGQ